MFSVVLVITLALARDWEEDRLWVSMTEARTEVHAFTYLGGSVFIVHQQTQDQPQIPSGRLIGYMPALCTPAPSSTSSDARLYSLPRELQRMPVDEPESRVSKDVSHIWHILHMSIEGGTSKNM